MNTVLSSGMSDVPALIHSGSHLRRLTYRTRRGYEEQAINLDPEDTYGTGIVVLDIWKDGAPMYMRGLPITFSKDAAKEIPLSDTAWRDRLLEETGAAAFLRWYGVGTCWEHHCHRTE